MAENSKIEWCDHTLNPWLGCTKVHDGCTKCYAEAFTKRTGKTIWGPNGTRVKTSEANWRKPLKWDREAKAAGVRARVFCASLADVFEDWSGPVLDHHGKQLYGNSQNGVGTPSPIRYDLDPTELDDLRRDLFALIDATPNLDWLLLTKRPENIRRMWPMFHLPDPGPHGGNFLGQTYHRTLRNVHLGTSVSNQATADKMLPELLKCRDLCPVLFVSAEPLLGPVLFWDLQRSDGWRVDALRGEYTRQYEAEVDEPGGIESHGNGPHIDQIIFGVESSGAHVGRLGEFANAAAFNEAVADALLECRSAGVAAFVKQLPINGKVSHDPAEWPEWARVREFPRPLERLTSGRP